MSGYPEPGEHPMTILRDTDDQTKNLAKAYIARCAHRESWSYDQIIDALEHLGLTADDQPRTKTDLLGKTVRPEVAAARRERNREYKRNARAKEKDAS